jgi:hypothetical protein
MVCNGILMAQTPWSFFPCEVSNLWQYRYNSGVFDSWRITRDSTNASGSRFLFGVRNNSAEFLRYKLDTTGNVYSNPPWWNTRDYDLKADTGEAWIWYNNGYHDFYAWLYAITAYPVFGMRKTVKIFRFGPFHPDSGGNAWYYTEQHLASDFGLVYETGEPSYALFLRGCVISGDSFGIILSVRDPPRSLPEEIVLHQNYPNPFNATTTVVYEVAKSSVVSLRIYDIVGRQVGVLAEGFREQGRHAVWFDASGFSSGVYLCRIATQFGTQTKRMVLLR